MENSARHSEKSTFAYAMSLIFICLPILLIILRQFTAGVAISPIILIASILPGILLINILKYKTCLQDFMMLGFLAYMCIWSFINLSWAGSITTVSFLHFFLLILGCPLAFFFGRIAFDNIKTSQLWKLFYLSVLLILIYLMASVWGLTNDLVLTQAGSDYQIIGDIFSCLALLIFSRSNHKHRILIIGITLVAMIFIGSRASLLALVIAIALSKVRYFFIISLSFAIVLYTFQFIIAEFLEDFSNEYYQFSITRIIISFNNLVNLGIFDASLAERSSFFENGLESILNFPFFGNPDYFSITYLGAEYVHGLLHLWAAYGFLPFFLILIAIIQPVYYFFVFSSTRKYFGLFIFLVVSMLFLRHPENIYLFFMLGGLVSLVSKETHQETKAANFL